jgi:hypothetical protein
MALFKKAGTSLKSSIDPLNKPDWKEYNMGQIKLASIQKNKDSDLGGFDLQAEIDKHPDNLFVKVFAIKKDEVNDNADAFSEAELIKATHTFIGVPVFCNHQNDDVEKARGIVVHAWYDKEKGGINTIARVDRVAYPTLARGIEEGIIVGTSMGCSVDYSLCSICHNKAHTAEEYCDCVKHRKNKKFSGKVKCEFHESKNEPVEDCPICGSKKGKTKQEKELKEAKIYEHNFGIKFIEDSFVVNPACHDCLVQEIFNTTEFEKKVASIKNKVMKLANVECTTGCSIDGKLQKVAGKNELQDLSQVMDILEKVAKSMMSQKQYVSMEYVSDLVETLANVQSTLDELTEMGYGQIPSPQLTGQENIQLPKTSEEALSNTTTGAPLQQQTPSPTALPTAQESAIEPMGDLGTITKPKLSGKKKEFIKESTILIKKLGDLYSKFSSAEENSQEIATNKLDQTKESKMTDKHSSENAGIEKVAAHDTDVITEKQLPNAAGTGTQWNDAPNVIGEKQLNDTNANKNKADFGNNFSTNSVERTASPDVITEKQLSSVKEAVVARWNEFPEVITEKQWTDMSDLIGSDLSKDQGNIITEKQMADFLSHHRYAAPEVITEKQLPGQSSDLARWASTSFDRKAIVKAAMSAVSDMIAYFHKTPSEIKKVASFVNDKPKNLDKAAFMVLINALPHKAEARKAERDKYTYFSKIAESGVAAPSALDALVLSVSDNLGTLSADDVLQAVKHVANSDKGMIQIEASAKAKIIAPSNTDNVMDKTAEFDLAIRELDRPEDGTYEIRASIDEIGVSPTDKIAFVKATTKFAASQIGDPDLQLVVTNIDMDDKKKVLVATVKDINALTEEEKKAFAEFGSLKQRPNPRDDAMRDMHDEGEHGSVLNIGEEDPAIDEDPLGSLMEEQEVRPRGTLRPSSRVASRKEGRDSIVKQAQMMGGEMGGQGGAGQGPGAGATLPNAPAGPGAGGAPAPLESFEEQGAGDDLMGDDEGDASPMPPGSICPVCASKDVDIIKGEGKCNNCSSEFAFKVNIEVTKWADMLEDSRDDGEAGADEDPLKGEGFELPEPGAAPETSPATANIPAAASTKNDKIQKTAFAAMTKLTTAATKKAAAAGVKFGSVSPFTGTMQTIDLGNGKHACLDTGLQYRVAVAVDKKNPKNVYAQWEWSPEDLVECSDCSRAKTSFLKALEASNMTEVQFDALPMKDKAHKILEMKKAGAFKQIKTASKNSSVIKTYKQAMAPLENFPEEICRERIYRRFGQDAVALSGPFEGENLADAIIKTLTKASVYSNRLADKVASIWCDKDGIEECLEDRIREGFEIKQASVVCEALKAKYAQFDDEFADGLEEEIGASPIEDGMGESEETEPDFGGEEVDPFESEDFGAGSEEMGSDEIGSEEIGSEEIGGGAGNDVTITLTVPVEVAEQLDQAVQTALEGGEGDMGGMGDIGSEEGPIDSTEIDIEFESDPSSEMDVVEDGADDIVEDITDEETAPEGDSSIEEDAGIALDAELEAEDKEDCCGGEVGASQNPMKNMENKEGDLTEEVNDKEGAEFKTGEEPEEDRKPCKPCGMTAETEEDIIKEATYMRKSHITRNNEINMDLSGVLAVLNKQAGDVGQQNAQDTKSVGKIKGDSTIGDEPKFEAEKPTAPSGTATMGDEKSNKALSQSDKANIPTGDALMGGEKDNDLKPELDDKATGGEVGAGNSKATTARRQNDLADRIKQAMDKTADEKSVNRKQIQDDEDIKPVSGDSFIGNEKESIGEVPAAETTPAGVPRNEAFIGNEKESIGDKPDAKKMAPKIPTTDARVGGEKDNENIAPEKTDEMTGHANTKGSLASGEDKSQVRKEAFRIAGRMLVENVITAEQLSTKVTELSKYALSQLKDLERGMFSSKRGLKTPSDGMEQAVIVSEASTEKDAKERHIDQKDELVNKLAGMFSLNRMVEAAQSDSDTELRKIHNRR